MKGLKEYLGLTGGIKDLPASVRWGAVLTASGKHIYAGTVPEAEVRRRRAKNRRARASRRINRTSR